MDQSFSSLEISKSLRSKVFKVVDKLEKLTKEDWISYAQDSGLTKAQVTGLLDLLNNQDLWRESQELVEFFELISAYGIEDYVSFNPKIIRGLDYYTGIVFEAFELGGKSRAILGGGRYDNLVADVGGNPLTGVGFAMGDVVIELVLREKGVIPQELGETPQVIVTVFDDQTMVESLRITNEIRNYGFTTVLYPDPDKLGKQFKFASKAGIPIAIVLGPDEISNNQVAVKNLLTREQVMVDRGKLLTQIRDFLP